MQYRINVKGGTPSQNKAWSAQITRELNQVQGDFAKLIQERKERHNKAVLQQALYERMRGLV